MAYGYGCGYGYGYDSGYGWGYEDMDMVLGSQWVLLFAEGDSFRLIYAAKHFRFVENGFVYVSFLLL